MNMITEQQTLTCIQCARAFVWPDDEREGEIYQSHGFQAPKRCGHCRRNNRLRARWEEAGRPVHVGTCNDCGREAVVPFEIEAGHPIHCYECHLAKYPQRHNNREG